MNRKQKKQKQYSNRSVDKFNLLRNKCTDYGEYGIISDRAYVDIIVNKLSRKERKIVLAKYQFSDNFYKLLEDAKVSIAFEKHVL